MRFSLFSHPFLTARTAASTSFTEHRDHSVFLPRPFCKRRKPLRSRTRCTSWSPNDDPSSRVALPRKTILYGFVCLGAEPDTVRRRATRALSLFGRGMAKGPSHVPGRSP